MLNMISSKSVKALKGFPSFSEKDSSVEIEIDIVWYIGIVVRPEGGCEEKTESWLV